MLKGKQKRFLRAMAVNTEPICHIGKEGLSANLLKQVADALEARELVKIRVLNNCAATASELAPQVAEQVKAELVQVIGHNFVVYRLSKKKNLIELPK